MNTAVEFPVAPVAPRKPRPFGSVLTWVVVIGLVASALAVTPPAKTSAYSWSPWITRYYTASANECKAVKRLATKFIGPIQYYRSPYSSCLYRVRSRYAIIDDWFGYADRLIQIDNSAPYWADAWGMRLEVRVHWNGVRARYSPESLRCTKWGFLIGVTKTDCTVFGDGTALLTARMAYEASFSVMFLNAAVDRGAQVSVDRNGMESLVTKWP